MTETSTPTLPLPLEASSHQAGTDDDEADDATALARLEATYHEAQTSRVELSASQLALAAHVRKATAVEWLRKQAENGAEG